MRGYISFLIDNKSIIQEKKVTLFCDYKSVVKKVHPLTGGKVTGTEITVSKTKLFEKYSPLYNRKEYMDYCIKQKIIPSIQEELDADYIAGIFDYFTTIKVNKKDNKSYCVFQIRNNKNGQKDMIQEYFKMPNRKTMQIQGEQLLYMIEDVKNHCIVKKNILDIVAERLMDTKNPYAFDDLTDKDLIPQ